MKIYLTDQTKNFIHHLEELKTQNVMVYHKSELIAKSSQITISTTTIEETEWKVLFDYKIFPSNIMSYFAEWHHEKREMQIGDTIVQQVFIPPVKQFSQKIIFGVRIKEIFDDQNRKGFSYETLNGHVEKGISTFTIEQDDAKTIFKIETFSRPGNLLSKILGPFFSVPYQSFCTKAALNNVRSQL